MPSRMRVSQSWRRDRFAFEVIKRSFINQASIGEFAMMGSIRILREISLRCQQGKPLDEKHLSWLGESLRKFLNQQCISVDEAFGIKNPRGGVPWWREEQIRVRDGALRELARSLDSNASVTGVARQICTLAKRYEASAWRFDRELDVVPNHYDGTPKEILWRAFKSGAPMPLGERQLRQVIGNPTSDERSMPRMEIQKL